MLRLGWTMTLQSGGKSAASSSKPLATIRRRVHQFMMWKPIIVFAFLSGICISFEGPCLSNLCLFICFKGGWAGATKPDRQDERRKQNYRKKTKEGTTRNRDRKAGFVWAWGLVGARSCHPRVHSKPHHQVQPKSKQHPIPQSKS